MNCKSDKRDNDFRMKVAKMWEEHYKDVKDSGKFDGMLSLAIKILSAMYIDIKEQDKELFFSFLKNEVLATADYMKEAIP